MSDPTTPQSDLATKAAEIATDVEQITGGVAKIATATWWTAIIGLLTALPGIIDLLQQFLTFWKSVSGNNPQAFIADLGTVMNQINTAQTIEEKQNAATNLSGLIAKLKSK